MTGVIGFSPRMSPARLGLIIGITFGAWNLLWTWLRPLADDSIPALLAFYGPMFRMGCRVILRRWSEREYPARRPDWDSRLVYDLLCARPHGYRAREYLSQRIGRPPGLARPDGPVSRQRLRQLSHVHQLALRYAIPSQDHCRDTDWNRCGSDWRRLSGCQTPTNNLYVAAAGALR